MNFLKHVKENEYKKDLLKLSEQRVSRLINDMAGCLCTNEYLYKKNYYLVKILESYEKRLKNNNISPKLPDVEFGDDFVSYVRGQTVDRYVFGKEIDLEPYDKYKKILQEKYMDIG